MAAVEAKCQRIEEIPQHIVDKYSNMEGLIKYYFELYQWHATNSSIIKGY